MTAQHLQTTMLVDRGAIEHLPDDTLNPGFKDQLKNHAPLGEPKTIVTAGTTSYGKLHRVSSKAPSSTRPARSISCGFPDCAFQAWSATSSLPPCQRSGSFQAWGATLSLPPCQPSWRSPPSSRKLTSPVERWGRGDVSATGVMLGFDAIQIAIGASSEASFPGIANAPKTGATGASSPAVAEAAPPGIDMVSLLEII